MCTFLFSCISYLVFFFKVDTLTLLTESILYLHECNDACDPFSNAGKWTIQYKEHRNLF